MRKVVVRLRLRSEVGSLHVCDLSPHTLRPAVSTASLSAPLVSRVLTRAVSPFHAATIIGVKPRLVFAFRSIPSTSSRRLANAALFDLIAR